MTSDVRSDESTKSNDDAGSPASRSALDSSAMASSSESSEKIAIEVARLQHEQDADAAEGIASKLIEDIRNSEMSWALDPKADAEDDVAEHDTEDATESSAGEDADNDNDYEGLGKRRRDA